MNDEMELDEPTLLLPAKAVNPQDALQLDSVKARLVTAIFRAGASLYRFMTTVEAGTYCCSHRSYRHPSCTYGRSDSGMQPR